METWGWRFEQICFHEPEEGVPIECWRNGEVALYCEGGEHLPVHLPSSWKFEKIASRFLLKSV